MEQSEFYYPDLNTYKSLEVIRSLGRLIIYINGNVKYDIEESDKATLKFAVIHLYLQWNINQSLIASNFGITNRTLFNWIDSFRKYGVPGLEKKQQGPPVKITEEFKNRIISLRKGGENLKEISRIFNISMSRVSQILKSAGMQTYNTLPGFEAEEEKRSEPEETAVQDINTDIAASEAVIEIPEKVKITAEEPERKADSNIDPYNRNADRMNAVLGLEEDAEPIFALALLSKDIFFDETVKVYRTMGAAFYGLRNTFMMLFLMAFLRIKNPEQSSGLNILILGRLLGLDRAPSVKTIRRKVKYLKKEYALDHLCTFRTLPVSDNIDHPNPEYSSLKKKISVLNKKINIIVGNQLKDDVNDNSSALAENIKKLNSGKSAERLKQLRSALKNAEKAIEGVPERVSASVYSRLDSKSRLITNIVKMTAYHIEGKLAEILSFHYKGVNGNERGLISAMLKSSGSIKVDNGILKISIAEQSTPDRTRMLKALCSEITVTAAKFPGTELRMVFDVAQNL